jgi:Tfp pilus assembly protein FimT
VIQSRIGKDSGFSLVELVLVAAVMIIVCGTAIPVFSNIMNMYGLESAAFSMYVDMQEARLLAIKRNRSVTVTFNQTGRIYQSTEGKTGYLPSGVTFVSVSTNPAEFTSRGTATASTIQITNPFGNRQIEITASGRVRLTR